MTSVGGVVDPVGVPVVVVTVVVLAIAATDVVVIEESLTTVVVVSAVAPVVLDPPGDGSVIVDAGDVLSTLTASPDVDTQADIR